MQESQQITRSSKECWVTPVNLLAWSASVAFRSKDFQRSARACFFADFCLPLASGIAERLVAKGVAVVVTDMTIGHMVVEIQIMVMPRRIHTLTSIRMTLITIIIRGIIITIRGMKVMSNGFMWGFINKLSKECCKMFSNFDQWWFRQTVKIYNELCLLTFKKFWNRFLSSYELWHIVAWWRHIWHWRSKSTLVRRMAWYLIGSADLLSIRSSGTNINEIWIKAHILTFKKVYINMLSENCQVSMH